MPNSLKVLRVDRHQAPKRRQALAAPTADTWADPAGSRAPMTRDGHAMRQSTPRDSPS